MQYLLAKRIRGEQLLFVNLRTFRDSSIDSIFGGILASLAFCCRLASYDRLHLLPDSRLTIC